MIYQITYLDGGRSIALVYSTISEVLFALKTIIPKFQNFRILAIRPYSTTLIADYGCFRIRRGKKFGGYTFYLSESYKAYYQDFARLEAVNPLFTPSKISKTDKHLLFFRKRQQLAIF